MIWPWPCLVLSLPCLVLSCHCLAFELFGLVFGLGLVSNTTAQKDRNDTTWLTSTPVESTIPCDTRVREGVGLRIRVRAKDRVRVQVSWGNGGTFSGLSVTGTVFLAKTVRVGKLCQETTKAN